MNLAAMVVSLAGVAICGAILGWIFGWRAGYSACVQMRLDRWSERTRQ